MFDKIFGSFAINPVCNINLSILNCFIATYIWVYDVFSTTWSTYFVKLCLRILTGQAGILGSCCYIYLYVLPRHYGSDQSTGDTWGRTPVYHWRTWTVAQKEDNKKEDKRLDISSNEIVKLLKYVFSLLIVHCLLMMIHRYRKIKFMYLTYCFSPKKVHVACKRTSIYIYLHFLVSLPVIALRINFLLYSQINSNDG